MEERKFDPRKLEKLNNPQRLIDIPPDYPWEKLAMGKPNVLVDIGAGTALYSIAFLQKYQPEIIYACDSSDVMYNWLKENIPEKYPNIIPLKTEENAIPLDNGIADLVFMINLYHELHNQALMLREAHRLLKPGGKIFIADWKKEEMSEGPPVTIRFFPEQVEEQLINAGFEQTGMYNDLKKHFLVIGEKSSLPA
ncbi:class I SAM-dependent methyltransferase [Desulforhopalus vacuolatus]|uniref:class I SAM-dependent methyltransferase n=1 Tax=Desulforhopalus vacuolatus TaxID=40414 RepID=UPI0019646B0E|nr:class I SAM-dependent methyltransferase [Desulforhopalus vacuolatus]MBM9520115.1 class I SAM-dependent methyltransferase [Desulforhopalus vacuolatus]